MNLGAPDGALTGPGIDNALIELDGPELPILDGSATPFLKVIRQAGKRTQNALRKTLKVQRPILVRKGDAYIKAYPSGHFRVRDSLDFPHPLVGSQEYTFTLNESTFHDEIAQARTLGFLRDVQRLQSMGPARGGSLENALVFDDFSVLDRHGFRFADECVRHEILDLLGDLALAGMPIGGHFTVHKAGRSLRNRFLKELTHRPTCCDIQAAPTLPVPLFPFPAAAPAFVDPLQAISKHLQRVSFRDIRAQDRLPPAGSLFAPIPSEHVPGALACPPTDNRSGRMAPGGQEWLAAGGAREI